MKIISILVLSTLSLLGIMKFNNENLKAKSYPDYESEWKAIEQLMAQGLNQDALKSVETLFQRALNEKNMPQIYKALVHIEQFKFVNDENGQEAVLRRLEERVNTLPDPVNKIIESVLGEMYWARYQSSNGMYRGADRTNIQGQEQDDKDIDTWSPASLLDKSNQYYIQSLRSDKLKQEILPDYKPILNYAGDEMYRPSLYDLLLQRAIQHFSDARTSLNQVKTKFISSQLFANETEFLNMKFDTSIENEVFLLYQQAMQYHKNNNNAAAIFDLNLQRLNYGLALANNTKNKRAYITALEELYEKNVKQEFAGDVLYTLASVYVQQNQEIEQVVDKFQNNKLVKADSLLSKVESDYPNCRNLSLAKSLRASIRSKNLQVQIEKVQLPDQAFRSLVSYKNVKQVYFKLYKINGLPNSYNLNTEEAIQQFMQSNKVMKSWSVALHDPGDFNEHHVEIKMEPLKRACYFLIASDNESFTNGNDILANYFQVSSLAAITLSNGEGLTEILTVDRNSGKPMSKVNVSIWQQVYDRSFSGEWKKIKSSVSDKNGKVSYTTEVNGQLLLETKDDVLWPEDWISNYRQYNQTAYTSTQFFTDRSIYRPGQTVHFKALVINHDKDRMPSIKANSSVKIILRNANWKEESSLQLKTNAFGSVSGSFVLPTSGLMGNFSLESNLNGAQNIKVEEYKRPNFEVIMDTIKNNYQLGDHISMSGKAVSFNGIALDQVEGTYRVYREEFVPWYPCWYYRRFVPFHAQREEITNGILKTDVEGKFVVQFKTDKADEGSSDLQKVYQYYLQIDVTDINGETQSGSQSIVLQKDAFTLRTDLNYNSLKNTIEISSQNLQNNPTAATIHVKVFALNKPENYLRKRLWEAPDQWLYSESDYKKWFPYDVYKDEDDAKSWKEKKLIIEKSIVSDGKTNLDLSKTLEPGAYKIVLEATSKDNKKASLTDYFIYIDNKKQNPSLSPSMYINSTRVEPGTKVDVLFPELKDKYYMYYIKSTPKASSSTWMEINKAKLDEIKIAEEYHGGINLFATGYYHNEFIESNQTVDVPWTNKELEIVSSTFRDKLLPGTNEEWVFEIKSKDGKKINAELLASMYDASLDKIYPHQWTADYYPSLFKQYNIQSQSYQLQQLFNISHRYYDQGSFSGLAYSTLNYFGLPMHSMMPYATSDVLSMDGVQPPMPKGNVRTQRSSKNKAEETAAGAQDKSAESAAQQSVEEQKLDEPVRSNLAETVFFYPEINASVNGNYIIKFKMNDALTKWKLNMFAHSVDLKYGFKTLEVITSKPLQVKPNYPRFFRQNDIIYFQTKVSNTSEVKQDVSTDLNIFDLFSNTNIGKEIVTSKSNEIISINPGESKSVQWQLKIPSNETRTFLVRVSAKGTNHSDSEEFVVPVLSNKMLVTETLPMAVKAGQTKNFNFSPLTKLGLSPTTIPQSLTLELSSHPVWYAVQSLPYIMEYPHDCVEQLTARFYANALGANIMTKFPKVKSVLEQQLKQGENISPLEKNKELKSALLEETPWIWQAESESAQMKNVALLMDLNKMSSEKENTLRRLVNMQYEYGAFSWFPGAYPDRYMTQNVIIKLAQLYRLKILHDDDVVMTKIVNRGLNYLDAEFLKQYQKLEESVKKGETKWEDNHLDFITLQYLQLKSMLGSWKADKNLNVARDYYLSQMDKYWHNDNIYWEGLCALVASRYEKGNLAQLITKSLKQRAVLSEELGMYWKNNWSWWWYQLPVETQSLLIEVFHDVAIDAASVSNLKTWLLKNKQTNHWASTQATTAAIYALLAFGDNWTEENKDVLFKMNNAPVNFDKMQIGTGYAKKQIQGSDIKKEMANMQLSNPNKSVAWGAAYFQYFEDLDKIQNYSETNLKLSKELYIKQNSANGPVLKLVSNGNMIKIGDVLTVRLIIKSDREMEYIHLKDARAAGLESINQLSEYKWKDGLGFYENPKDLSTDFFISWLPKGSHVLEYDVRASQLGEFSNGISSIQSMYAPEFAAHSKGIRIVIAK